jgi:ribose transport system ATP-binding protein
VIVATQPVLAVEGLTKRFGQTTALAGVDLTVRAGTVHALVGMNGSGKSTLVKTLSGFHVPDQGRVSVGGRAVGEDGAEVAFVHQDLALVPGLSVIENLALGRTMRTRRGRIDWAAEAARANRALAPFGLERIAGAAVSELSKAEATVVAIARALERCEEGCAALVLDEPTSSLPASQTDQLLEVVRGCAERGIGVLFISHRLREVLAISDDVTVLRNGAVAYSASTEETTLASLVTAMVGDASGPLDRVVGDELRTAPQRTAPEPVVDAAVPVLAAVGLGAEVLQGIDLRVHAGEVLGVVGLLGSGVEELGELLSGRARPRTGHVELQGGPLGRKGAHRVGFVPADRPARGVLPGLSAGDNASITHVRRYLRAGRIARREEHRALCQWFDRMAVHPPDPAADMVALSGGNQQKVLLARWLAVDPPALVAEEPTQGVDVYAKAQILERLSDRAAEGLAVALLSGEPEEIAPVCDRVIVLQRGRVGAEFTRPFATGDLVAAMH